MLYLKFNLYNFYSLQHELNIFQVTPPTTDPPLTFQNSFKNHPFTAMKTMLAVEIDKKNVLSFAARRFYIFLLLQNYIPRNEF